MMKSILKKIIVTTLVVSLIASMVYVTDMQKVEASDSYTKISSKDLVSGQNYLLSANDGVSSKEGGEEVQFSHYGGGYSVQYAAGSTQDASAIPTTYFTTENVRSETHVLEDTEKGLQMQGTEWQYAVYKFDTPIEVSEIKTVTIRVKASGSSNAVMKFVNEDKEFFYLNVTDPAAETYQSGIVNFTTDEEGFTIITLDFQNCFMANGDTWTNGQRTGKLATIEMGCNTRGATCVFDYVSYNVPVSSTEFNKLNTKAGHGDIAFTEVDNALQFVGGNWSTYYAIYNYADAVKLSDFDSIRIRYKVVNSEYLAIYFVNSNGQEAYVGLQANNSDGVENYISNRTTDGQGYTMLDFDLKQYCKVQGWDVASAAISAIKLSSSSITATPIIDSVSYIKAEETSSDGPSNRTKLTKSDSNLWDTTGYSSDSADGYLTLTPTGWAGSIEYDYGTGAIAGTEIDTISVRYKTTSSVVMYLKNEDNKHIYVGINVDKVDDYIVSEVTDEEGFTIVTFDFQNIVSSDTTWSLENRSSKTLQKIEFKNVGNADAVFDYIEYNAVPIYEELPKVEFAVNNTDAGGYQTVDEDGSLRISGATWGSTPVTYSFGDNPVSGADIKTISVRYKTEDNQTASMYFVSSDSTRFYLGLGGALSELYPRDLIRVTQDGEYTILTVDFRSLLCVGVTNDTWTRADRTSKELASIQLISSSAEHAVWFDYVAFNMEGIGSAEFPTIDFHTDDPNLGITGTVHDGKASMTEGALTLSGATWATMSQYVYYSLPNPIDGDKLDTISIRYKGNGKEEGTNLFLENDNQEYIYLPLDKIPGTEYVSKTVDGQGFTTLTLNFQTIPQYTDGQTFWSQNTRSSSKLKTIYLVCGDGEAATFDSIIFNECDKQLTPVLSGDANYLNIELDANNSPVVTQGRKQKLTLTHNTANDSMTISREISGIRYYAILGSDGTWSAATSATGIYLYEITPKLVNFDLTYGESYLFTPDKTNVLIDGNEFTGRLYNEVGIHEVYYLENGQPCKERLTMFVRGDANADGGIDVKDLVRIKKYETGTDAPNDVQKYSANVDELGEITANDSQEVREKLIGTQKNIIDLDSSDVMPIGGYNGPYAHKIADFPIFTNEKYAQIVSEIGINLLVHSSIDYHTSPVLADKMLEYGEKYGIGYFLTDSRIVSSSVGDLTDVEAAKALINQHIGDYKDKAAFKGLYLVDEPIYQGTLFNYPTKPTDEEKERQLDNYDKITDAFNTLGINYYSNLYPYKKWSSNNFDINKAVYKQYVSEYMEIFEPEFLSWDFYVFEDDDADNTLTNEKKQYFWSLDYMKQQAKDKPMWGFVQAGGQWNNSGSTINGGYDESYYPSKGQFDWNVNTTLAFGAKGIQYFPVVQTQKFATVTKTTDEEGNVSREYDFNVNGLISANGHKTKWYYFAKEMNKHIAAIDDVLMKATFKGVLANGSDVTTDLSLVSNDTILTSDNNIASISDNTLVGCFDYNGKSAYYVVNYDTSNGQDVTLKFNAVQKVKMIQNAESSMKSTSELTLTMAAGEGVLIVMD